MAGVPGAGGPVPKRSDQRRRRNKTEPPTKALSRGGAEPPDPDESWHPVAFQFYDSLSGSGQSEFYEASDWATAFLLAESMSRDLSTGDPISGASLSAWLKAMSALLVTEGDRRRIRLELEAAPQVDPAEEAAVADLGSFRKRRAD